MNDKGLRGIALILFGILLCVGGTQINDTLLYNFVDLPFSLIGILVGAIGFAMAFDHKEIK